MQVLFGLGLMLVGINVFGTGCWIGDTWGNTFWGGMGAVNLVILGFLGLLLGLVIVMDE